MEKKGLIWASVLLLAIVISVAFSLYTNKVNEINSMFSPNPQYENLDLHTTNLQTVLMESGFNTELPGIEGNVEFESPIRFTLASNNSEMTIPKGTIISSDFVSYSGETPWGTMRYLVITIDKKPYLAMISASDAAKLYRSALEQNDLVRSFCAATGGKMTNVSVRNALRCIDRQLYEKGVCIPGDYPFDMWFWKRALTVVSIGFPVFLIVLLFLIPFLQSAMEYRAFLSHYNTEHTENWDKVAGTLPHFKSLGESGIDMTPKYFITESMLQKIKSFFQSPSK